MALSIASRITRRGEGPPLAVAADLCVVGAGIAGVSAALEGARLGAKVVLVDGAPMLGGQSVGAQIGTFCGLFANGPEPPQVTHGMADEILRDLGAQGDLSYLRGRRNTVIVQYRIEALARWIERAVRDAGIGVLLGAVARSVRRAGGRLAEIDCATRYGDVRVSAAGFVDASGDATLAWIAGLPVREAAGVSMQGTQMVVLERVDETAVAALDRAELQRRLATKGAAHGLRREDGFLFAVPGTGEALVNMTHLDTPLDPLGASAMVLDGHDQADRLLGFLRAEYPAAFAGARIRSYGLPGVRQTRSIVGAYMLAAEDVRAGRDFPDTVARCSWPIELHDRQEGVHWEQFGDDHMHHVPLRSLTAPEVDNLVAVGRCIDADPVALSSVRVMGPCIAMGAAAAHALDLAGAGSVHQIDVPALRRRLAANLGLDGAS
jgi:hypothetical protein